MGTKAGLEYEVRHVRLQEETWRAECLKLTDVVNAAAGDGWTLVSLALPSPNWAVLALSRPKARPDAEDPGRPSGAAPPSGDGVGGPPPPPASRGDA
jgi:hypothetical protein